MNIRSEEIRNFLAEGMQYESLNKDGEEEIFYAALDNQELIAASRLIINPTPEKMNTWDVDSSITNNYVFGMLSGIYVLPEYRGPRQELNNQSIAKNLAQNRIQDSWQGNFMPQAQSLDVLMTYCFPSSAKIYDANSQFKLIDEIPDMPRGTERVYLATNPNKNLPSIDDIANTYYKKHAYTKAV